MLRCVRDVALGEADADPVGLVGAEMGWALVIWLVFLTRLRHPPTQPGLDFAPDTEDQDAGLPRTPCYFSQAARQEGFAQGVADGHVCSCGDNDCLAALRLKAIPDTAALHSELMQPCGLSMRQLLGSGGRG